MMIAALLYNGVLSSGVAWLLWSYVVEKLPANVAGLSSLAVPIVGIGFAWAILGEVPSASESVGIVAICVALAVVNVHRPARATATTKRDPAT
jgi:drug/metabolite transporter (DMT)-like permease